MGKFSESKETRILVLLVLLLPSAYVASGQAAPPDLTDLWKNIAVSMISIVVSTFIFFISFGLRTASKVDFQKNDMEVDRLKEQIALIFPLVDRMGRLELTVEKRLDRLEEKIENFRRIT